MKVIIEKQSDGTYIAYNPEGEGAALIGTGESVSEAKDDFFNSAEEVKASFTDKGEKYPEWLDGPMEFRFDIASLFEYFGVLNVSAVGRYLGINGSLMRQYRNGSAPISDKQLEKIQDGLRHIGQELSALRLV